MQKWNTIVNIHMVQVIVIWSVGRSNATQFSAAKFSFNERI